MPHPAEQRCSPLQEHGLWSHPSRRALHGAGVGALVPLVLTVFILTHHLRRMSNKEAQTWSNAFLRTECYFYSALLVLIQIRSSKFLIKVVMIIVAGTLVNRKCQNLTAWEWNSIINNLSRIVYFSFKFQKVGFFYILKKHKTTYLITYDLKKVNSSLCPFLS